MMAEEAMSWLRTLDVETETPVEGIITGNIPDWLEGALIRNGPGIYQIGTTTMEHLFDGLPVLHRFAIKGGKATYQNRILKCRAYLEGKEANRLTLNQFGTFAFPDPCKSTLGKFMTRFDTSTDTDEMTDSCSVNVCYIGDKLYAMTETVLMRQIDPESLETIGDQLNVSKYVAVNHSTAHPHVDKDGTVFNMGTTYAGRGQGYNIIQFPPGEASFTGAKIAATFPAHAKLSTAYYHSFGITDNYFVFIEQPLFLNSLKLLTMKMRQEPFNSTMEWHPKEPARIMLADRATGKIVPQIYEAPPFFTFHHGNAYEKDGYLIMDLSYYSDATIVTDLILKNMKEKGSSTNPYYTRYVLPLNPKVPEDKSAYSNNLIELEGFRGKSYWLDNKRVMCEPDRLCDEALEFPRINYHFNGKPYRFVYGASKSEDSAEFTKILKLDLETKETKEWTKEGLSISEPVFVARSGSTEEDEGCVIFSAVDLKNPKRVLLVILDGVTFDEAATVDFSTNGVVTRDFHGMFSRDGESNHLY